MVEAHRVNAIEIRQIVLVGHVVAMPRNNIQRRMIDRSRPEFSLELGHNPVIAFAILKRRDWSQKVARFPHSIRANPSQIRQTKQPAIDRSSITTLVIVRQSKPKSNS